MFDTARDATECAFSLQQAVAARTAEQPIDRRITFRMAVNLADVIVSSVMPRLITIRPFGMSFVLAN